MAYYIFTDANGHWRWRLVSGNNKSIAISGEGYWNKSDCINAINLVKSSYSAPVYEI